MSTPNAQKRIDEVMGYDLKPSDKKVIAAFLDQQAADGQNLSSDGEYLTSPYQGRNQPIAYWEDGKIRLGQGTGNVSQTWVNAVRKLAPRGLLREEIEVGQSYRADVKRFKDRGYGNQAKILSTMLRRGHGEVYVASVSRDGSEAEIAGSEMDALLGTLMVPTAILRESVCESAKRRIGTKVREVFHASIPFSKNPNVKVLPSDTGLRGEFRGQPSIRIPQADVVLVGLSEPSDSFSTAVFSVMALRLSSGHQMDSTEVGIGSSGSFRRDIYNLIHSFDWEDDQSTPGDIDCEGLRTNMIRRFYQDNPASSRSK